MFVCLLILFQIYKVPKYFPTLLQPRISTPLILNAAYSTKTHASRLKILEIEGEKGKEEGKVVPVFPHFCYFFICNIFFLEKF